MALVKDAVLAVKFAVEMGILSTGEIAMLSPHGTIC